MIEDVRPPGSRQRKKPTPKEPNFEPAVADVVVAPEPGISDSTEPMIQMPGSGKADPSETPITEPTAHTEPAFHTPEEVASAENPDPTPPKKAKTSDSDTKGKWYKPPWPPTKKQLLIYGSAFILLLGAGGFSWKLTHQEKATPTPVAKKKTVQKPVAPKVIYSTLTGLPITDEALNHKPVTGVMIENSIDARPQSGLGSAGVVFEAVAEGGVTRFLALFQDTSPKDVGPIRSARPYYVQWAMGFDAAYAHVGGSPDALANIASWGTKDMNQFSNGNYYHRVTSRAAPHNVYTSIDTLNELEKKKGFTSTFTGFARKKEAPSATANATQIKFSLSGPTYDPSYIYNAATNSYSRSEAGAAHMDANTNTQITPKVVIAMVTPLGRGALDSSGAYYSNYTVTGSGTAYIFQDGIVTVGNWNKASTSGALTFTDTTGNPLPLNPGQTWISAVSSTSGVSYK